MSTVNCPACDEELDLDDAYRDWTVRCPHCGREFVPSHTGRTQQDKEEEEREEEEEYDDNYVYGHQGTARQDAKAIVAAPAILMEVIGWGGAILMAIICLIALLNALNQGNRGNDGEGLLVCSCMFGIIVVPMSVVIAIGGRHMRQMSSRGWSITGAVVCIAMLVPGCGIGGVLHAALAVWALIALESQTVRRAYGLESGRRRRY
jgi:hypothetical protein